jgi:hypothetical protein
MGSLHAMNKGDPDLGAQFCECLQHRVHEYEEFVNKIVWSDEATIMMNGTVNRRSCVYWVPETPHIHVDKAVSLPGLTVWRGLSYRGLIGLFFFEGTVTGPMYLNILWTSILTSILQLCGNEPYYFQQDGEPPHYDRDV